VLSSCPQRTSRSSQWPAEELEAWSHERQTSIQWTTNAVVMKEVEELQSGTNCNNNERGKPSECSVLPKDKTASQEGGLPSRSNAEDQRLFCRRAEDNCADRKLCGTRKGPALTSTISSKHSQYFFCKLPFERQARQQTKAPQMWKSEREDKAWVRMSSEDRFSSFSC
jgi:hypothetical protein